MLFLIVGLLLIMGKSLEIAPFAAWSWWWVLSPLPLAVVWWHWSDFSGRTRRLAEEAQVRRARARREERAAALGLRSGDRRRGRR